MSAIDRARRGLTRRATVATARAQAARARARRRVLVLGDSHAAVFRQPGLRRLPIGFELHEVGGATLTGLANRASATGARVTFDAALDAARTRSAPPEAVLTLLGEVDCGFVLWKQHERDGTPLPDLLDVAVERFREFVTAARAVAPVVVLSPPLPTLDDQSGIGEYASARRSVRATRRERTDLVRDLGARCAVMAEASGATYLDLDPDSLGPGGEVSPLLVAPDPTDHHYDKVVYARLLARRLAPVLGYELPD